MMQKSISYIVAGYNGGPIIEEAVREVHAALSIDFTDFEIILVNDASTDNTGEIMDRLSQELDNTTVLHNLVNLNFGTSVLRGLMAATKDFIIYNAVDLPLSPDKTAAIIKEMDKYDLLVLERNSGHTTGWRKVTSFLNKLLLHILFPGLTRGTPILNFIQVFRRDIVKHIVPLARSPIFVWPEMIFRAKLNKDIRVGNMLVEITVKDYGKGSFGKPHDIIWGIYDMLRYRIRGRK